MAFLVLEKDYIERLSLHKSVHIQGYSGPHSVRMQDNTDQNNSE